MSNLTLNTKVFTGSGLANAIYTWYYRAAGVVVGWAKASVNVQLGVQKNRVNWKLNEPVVAEEATSCACPSTVLRNAAADISVRFDAGATTAERTDFALKLKDLVASADFQNSLINFEYPAS